MIRFGQEAIAIGEPFNEVVDIVYDQTSLSRAEIEHRLTAPSI